MNAKESDKVDADKAAAFDEEVGARIEEQAPQVPKESNLEEPSQKHWFGIACLVFFALAIIGGIVAGAVVGTRNKTESEPSTTTLSGQIVDIHNDTIYPAIIVVKDHHIAEIRPAINESAVEANRFILPGFVDSHVHIESSLLVPSEFARLAVLHGTVATISDPHEIANVLGRKGIQFMLDNAEQVPLQFFFGAPCCIPATPFETAGAELTVEDIEELFQDDRIKFLSEMMNWPGVLYDDPVVLAKIQAAVYANRTIDGHAPGLTGDDAANYISHGITTDHETYGLEEAQDKLSFGMKIQIREGSASRNFNTLHPIIGTDPENVMFCTDDLHPNLLLKQEVDYHVRQSVALGYDLFDVLRIASKNPVEHYNLPVGLLRENDSADFVVVDSLTDFNVLETWVQGIKVAESGNSLIDRVSFQAMNNFHTSPISVGDIAHNYTGEVRVIVAHDGLIITTEEIHNITDPDILKFVVVNRYEVAPPAVGYIKGFGLDTGAIASSVAHDSHNILAVGVSDEDIVNAINSLIAVKGGLAVSANGQTEVLPLPVAGIMSDGDAFAVAKQYSQIDQLAKTYGTLLLQAPFMTLSFMALLVIPELKLSDKGLFDGLAFEFVEVEV